MGFFKRLAELPPVNQRVPPVVELGMTHKDEVVNGDNGVDSCGFYALWQFARQPMEHVYAVAQQVFHHASASPRSLLQCVFRALGIHHAQVLRTFHLSGQIFSALIGCIKQQLHVRIEGCEIVHKVASVCSQPRSITHHALGIKAYNDVLVFVHNLQTYTKKV